MSRSAALLVSIAALVFVGCGGDEEEQASTAAKTTTSTQPKAKQQQSAEKTQSEQSTQGDRQSSSANSGPAPGTKAVAPGVPVSPGGDNSVQTYGAEGEVDQRNQAYTTARTYLRARAAGEWARACEQVSGELEQGFKQLTGGAREENENAPKGCTGALRALTAGVPGPALRREARLGKLLSFRVEGEQAFLIVEGAGDTARFMPMDDEEGEWKVGGLTTSEFFLGA